MKQAFIRVISFLLFVLILINPAHAENNNLYYLTQNGDQIKTQHDKGFSKPEVIDEKDPHFGWGLGRFYIQGYSEAIQENDTPVFLKKENDRIFLHFELQQDINKLNGKSDLRINDDGNDRDNKLGVKGTKFGRGCLIIQRIDSSGHINTDIKPNYLLNISEDTSKADIGPLNEGSYIIALDYEVQSGTVLPGYNDYKISFTFKIQKDMDYYATVATINGEINPKTIQTVAIVVGIIFILAFIVFVIIKRIRSKDDPYYRTNPINDEQDTLIDKENTLSSNPKRQKRRSHMEPEAKKRIIIGCLLLFAILSILFIRPLLSNPSTYLGPISYLNEQAKYAGILNLGSAGVSILITALPGDTGTPVANQLAQIASYLFVILCIINAEKYFITTIGLISSTIIIPLACMLMIICLLWEHKLRQKCADLSIRLFIFGICIALIIPLGCACGRSIDAIDKASMDTALLTAEQATEYMSQTQLSYSEKDEDKIEAAFADLTQENDIVKWASDAFHQFSTMAARILATTIIIPILMLIAFICSFKILTKKDYTKSALALTNKMAGKLSNQITGTGKMIKEKRSKRDI